MTIVIRMGYKAWIIAFSTTLLHVHVIPCPRQGLHTCIWSVEFISLYRPRSSISFYIKHGMKKILQRKEKSIFAQSVAKGFQCQPKWSITWEHILERSPSSARLVIHDLAKKEVWKDTWKTSMVTHLESDLCLIEKIFDGTSWTVSVIHVNCVSVCF